MPCQSGRTGGKTTHPKRFMVTVRSIDSLGDKGSGGRLRGPFPDQEVVLVHTHLVARRLLLVGVQEELWNKLR